MKKKDPLWFLNYSAKPSDFLKQSKLSEDLIKVADEYLKKFPALDKMRVHDEITIPVNYSDFETRYYAMTVQPQKRHAIVASVDTELDLAAEFERFIAESEEKRAIKIGEEVKHICGHGHFPAKVIDITENGYIHIEYSDKNLIPPRDFVPINQLQGMDGKKFINAKIECPKCKVPWKQSQGFHMDVYHDCPKCGAKREDYV